MPTDLTNFKAARTLALALALAVAPAWGCTSVKTTGTARTGTEQLLLTGAWDRLLRHVDFRPLAGQKVYVDPQFVTVVDKDWVVASTRRALASQGVLIEDKKDDARVVLEPAVGAFGTDDRSCTTGLPQIGLLPSLTGLPAAVPSSSASSSGSNSSTASALSLTQYNQQDAVVKASMLAYDAKTGRAVWDSGPLLVAEGVRDRFILGLGPIRSSSLREVHDYPEEAQARIKRRFPPDDPHKP